MQFHIANVTTSDFVRVIQLPLASQENITRMVASDSGEYIFAMTPSRVRPLCCFSRYDRGVARIFKRGFYIVAC